MQSLPYRVLLAVGAGATGNEVAMIVHISKEDNVCQCLVKVKTEGGQKAASFLNMCSN
jgi:hypothetical protein